MFGYASSGVENLEDAANLYYIATHPHQVLTHTFILGNSTKGHWITLTLIQNAQGEKQWIGTDSYGNNENIIKDVKNGLENLMTNPKAYAIKTYQDAVGEDLQRRTQMIDNTASDPVSRELILNIESEILKKASHAFEFMQKCNWFSVKDVVYEKEIHNLKMMVDYYQNEPLSTSNQAWGDLKNKIEAESTPQKENHKKIKHQQQEAINKAKQQLKIKRQNEGAATMVKSILKNIDITKRYKTATVNKTFNLFYWRIFSNNDRENQLKIIQNALTETAISININNIDKSFEKLEKVMHDVNQQLQQERKSSCRLFGESRLEKVLEVLQQEILDLKEGLLECKSNNEKNQVSAPALKKP